MPRAGVWSGLTCADAAEALGVPVSTVRSRLSRARQLRGLAEEELARRASSAGTGRASMPTAGSRRDPEQMTKPTTRPAFGTAPETGLLRSTPRRRVHVARRNRRSRARGRCGELGQVTRPPGGRRLPNCPCCRRA
ncbi:RNA polymerase sigma factor [Streptomyces albiflavescens]|uniref:RNA polymerase sigma factor n=1 Tax=Streptomyces albiflavescens TaxID=1623582 RepID=UPI00166818BA